MAENAKLRPLVIFYDSEAAYGNVFSGDIIEIAAKCHPDVVKGSFQSLIYTKQSLCAFAIKECAISEEDLRNKPFFKDVLKKFLSWIDNMVKQAKKRHGQPFVPVLCAHHGYQFDFLILLNNMERSGLHHSLLSQHNIHFADSLLFCCELKDRGENLLRNTRLSLDGLFKRFFPRRGIKDRHRAMGDVEALVDIFVETPLRKLLHHMKYSSTKDRLEYYISQAGFKQQQALLEEKLCQLDACSKNMSVRKLLKEGITYNSLITIFEECSSFLDFYETMKRYGIERKVAKVIALHFSGKGLENQGARAYSELHRGKFDSFDSKTETAENQTNGNHPLQYDHSDNKDKSKGNDNHPLDCIHPVNKQLDFKPTEGEGSEDWESEIAVSKPRTNFTLKCNAVTPLGLDVDDFSTACEKSKVVQSHSDTTSSCTTQAEDRGRGFRPELHVVMESNGKMGGSKNKPMNERKPDGKKKGKPMVSKMRNKKKAANSANVPKDHLSGKENEWSVGQESSNTVEGKGSVNDQTHPSGEDLLGKKQRMSASVTVSLGSDMSVTELVEEFATVLIGDITITVPTATIQQGYDPSGNALNEKGSSDRGQIENKTVDDLSTNPESYGSSMELDEVQFPQSESGASSLQSAHRDLETSLQEQTKEDHATECTNGVHSVKGDTSVLEKGVTDVDFSANTPSVANLESNYQEVNRIEDTRSNSPIFITTKNSVVDTMKATEETNCGEARIDCDTGTGEGTEGIGMPWDKLQQLPHTPLQEDAPVLERFVVSEGLACHGVNTDDMDHSRHDLRAELSSESSSTSGEFVDAFLRQPPLGAEREFTPDTCALQQQSDHLAWEGSVGAGLYSVPSVPSITCGVGVSYPQGTFQSYGNPYGQFHQTQQAVHLVKGCYSSFGYPGQIQPMIPPHIVQPQQQVVISPYPQCRNQTMFSNTMQQVTGFPTTTWTPLSYFHPQMYQVWQGPANFACSSVPFYGNQYDQMQESTGEMLAVGSIHSSQINASVDCQNQEINLSQCVSTGCVLTHDPGSATIDSLFQLINPPANSITSPVHEVSPVQDKESTESNNLVDSLLEGTQHDAEQEFNGMEMPGCVDIGTESSVAQLCDNELTSNEGDKSELTETCSIGLREFSTHPVSQDYNTLIHKQITILSREGSAGSMGLRRLSPDGSSIDGDSCATNSSQNEKEPSKENNEAMKRESENRTCDVSVREKGQAPKPQRIKGTRARKNKYEQDCQSKDHKQSKMVIPNLAKIPVPSASKIVFNAIEHTGHKTSVAASEEKTDGTVGRYSKETVNRDLVSCNSPGCGNVPSTDSIDTCPSHPYNDHDNSLHMNSSQRPARKRVYNGARRPYTGKPPQKNLVKARQQEKDRRTDTNNNSG